MLCIVCVFDVFSMNLIMVVGMCVCVEAFLYVCVCLLYRQSCSCPGLQQLCVRVCHLIEILSYCDVEVVEWRYLKPCCILMCCMEDGSSPLFRK